MLGQDVRDQWRLWVEVVAVRRGHLGHQIGTVRGRFKAVELLAATSKNALTSSDFVDSPCQLTPRGITVSRRQWALRRRKILAGPNNANMLQLVMMIGRWFPFESETLWKMPMPLVTTLVSFSRDRDQDLVLAAAKGLAGVSFNADSASMLGTMRGMIHSVVRLVQHANPEVVTLACDVHTLLVIKILSFKFQVEHANISHINLTVTVGSSQSGLSTTTKSRSIWYGRNCRNPC